MALKSNWELICNKKNIRLELKINMRKKILSLLLAAALTAGLFTACKSGTTTTVGTDSSTVVPPSSEASSEVPSSEAEKSHYPVTITTYSYAGDEVTTTYEKAPEKVLAVYQGSIETMLALGLEDNIVAAAGLDNPVKDEWKAAFDKVNYLEEFAPSKENVIMLKPDMILSWNSYFGEKTLGDVDYWHKSGVNTYTNTNTRAGGHDRILENEYTDIINLGKIFDVEEKAEALVKEMKDEVAKVLAEASKATEKKKVLVIEFMNDSISNYSATSLGGDMVKSLGAELVAPDAKQIGKEDIVALNPDVIFVVYMEKADGTDVKTEYVNKVLEDSALKNIDAAKNKTVYPLMLGDMYASGVRAMDGINTFAQGLYPELYK